jgi:hypothetical protein
MPCYIPREYMYLDILHVYVSEFEWKARVYGLAVHSHGLVKIV